MITRRSFAALSSSERQVLRSQRIQSGQCVRCFHASLQQRADACTSNANGTSQDAFKNPSPRSQRAAMISNEVAMLQKGPPPGDPAAGPGSVTGTYQSHPPAPTTSAGFVETPNTMGGERMGENASAGREESNAQGVGRLTGSDENVRNEHPTARGTKAPNDVQGPAEGAVSVLEASTPGPAKQISRTGSNQNIAVWSSSEERSLRNKLADVKPLGVPFRPRHPPREQILRSGSSAATPAGNQCEGVVLDRFKTVVSPARALLGREHVERLPKKTARKLAGALVSGKYDRDGILSGQTPNKQSTLNEVAKRLMLNGTYLAGDGERLLKKIQSLLPAATVARAPKKQLPDKA